MNDHSRPIRGLAEIALRVRDLDAMQNFYANMVGLELLQRFDTSAFFRIAEGVGGHTQIPAMFDRRSTVDYVVPEFARTTVDHLAFGVLLADFESELARLKSLGLDVTTAEHAWVQWRSLYVSDTDGNRVKLVCIDESIS